MKSIGGDCCPLKREYHAGIDLVISDYRLSSDFCPFGACG